jgi:DNA-binding NarL/FixJ family response regulator
MTPSSGAIVMLVDDLPQSLGALAQELEADGYTVLVAHSGDAALQLLDLVSPDAILMDALMPGLSGFETCRRIKADPGLQHIPVIFMTGLSETAHIVEGFDVGGHGVLVMDGRGRIAWRSPQAMRWCTEFFNTAVPAAVLPSALTDACADWLRAADASGDASRTVCRRRGSDARTLLARRLGDIGMGEAMWLLSLQNAGEAQASRLATAALTPRETEVLSWVAKGKTNRDVGDILGLSPRTVNKHLEHVFEKLGVETRAAATALAGRELG